MLVWERWHAMGAILKNLTLAHSLVRPRGHFLKLWPRNFWNTGRERYSQDEDKRRERDKRIETRKRETKATYSWQTVSQVLPCPASCWHHFQNHHWHLMVHHWSRWIHWQTLYRFHSFLSSIMSLATFNRRWHLVLLTWLFPSFHRRIFPVLERFFPVLERFSPVLGRFFSGFP